MSLPANTHMESALRSALDWWQEAGVETPPIKSGKAGAKARAARSTKRPAPPAKANTPALQTARSTSQSEAAEIDAVIKAAQDMSASAKTLEAFYEQLKKFNAGSLSDGARQAVISRGNPEARVMVIGEAPGQDEDNAGQPFIGPTGQFLDKVLASIGLTSDAVYLTNICNWRLPNNRKPAEAELNICRPIVTRHIELIQPKLIVLLGASAMSLLTGRSSITKCRGEWETIDAAGQPTPALICYHPAYVLRQPHLKRELWRDMLALKGQIDSL